MAWGAFLLFTVTGAGLVHVATGGPRPAVIIAAALALTGWVLRRRRLATWSETPLMFEDECPDQPQPLQL